VLGLADNETNRGVVKLTIKNLLKELNELLLVPLPKSPDRNGVDYTVRS